MKKIIVVGGGGEKTEKKVLTDKTAKRIRQVRVIFIIMSKARTHLVYSLNNGEIVRSLTRHWNVSGRLHIVTARFR